jgi:hypothetical protein
MWVSSPSLSSTDLLLHDDRVPEFAPKASSLCLVPTVNATACTDSRSVAVFTDYGISDGIQTEPIDKVASTAV